MAKESMDGKLVAGWEAFIGALGATGNNILTLLAIAGGAVMAWFLITWLWKKTRGGGGGGNPMSQFPWWPMAVGLVLTAPKFLIPLVLSVVEVVIKVVDVVLTKVVSTVGG